MTATARVTAPVAGTSGRLTNDRRMAAAVTLLDPEDTATPHPRAAVFLMRRALEEHLDAYLRRHRPALARCSMRTKTVWLAQHLDSAQAGRLAAAWHNLSCACHYQQYPMPPTAAEVVTWRTEVEHALTTVLEPQPTAFTPPTMPSQISGMTS